MAKTVNEGFNIFHERLTPSTGESEAAKKHRASMVARLKTDFDLMRFFRTGSFGNGTSIRGYSDVDYFASIPTKKLKRNSDATLRIVRSALDDRFPGTGVTINKPAILVPFGKNISEWTEVVPADYIKKDTHSRHIYDIPDGNGGWIKSSPDIHNDYVAAINEKLSHKVKPLVRFIKAWKYYMNVPVSSFYLEMRVAKYASEEKSIVYSIDLKRMFKLLLDIQLASIQDPTGISGYIVPCSSDSKKEEALSKVESAFTRAEKAYTAESAKKIEVAFYWWNLVFNGKFPTF